MNFGQIIRQALVRSESPVNSAEYLDIVRAYANDNIERIWEKCRPDYRKEDGTLSVVASTDTVALSKYFSEMIKNSVRGGTSAPRVLRYKNPSDFLRITAHATTDTGTPRIYTIDEVRKFETQLSAGSTLKIVSTVANVTTGTCAFYAGSRKVISSGSVFTLAHVGSYIKKSGDSKAYRIGKFISTSEVELQEKYRGTTNGAANYTLGDIGIYVTVFGIVGGQEASETVELNGTTEQTTSKTFTSIISVSKTDFTLGNVTIKNSAGTTTVSTLAAAEHDVEVSVIKLWPVPSASETLTYSFYRKHPRLRLDASTLLLPSRWHKLVRDLTTMDMLEFNGMAIPAGLSGKIVEGTRLLEDDADDTRLDTIVHREDHERGFGDEYYYDHDEDF